MIGPLVLTLPMLAIIAYALLELKRSRLVGFAIAVLTLAALSFIWVPGIAARVAEVLQLGGGTDVIIYSWIGLLTLILLNIHLRIRQQMQILAALARQIALANRQPPQGQPGPSTSRT